MIYFTSDLHLFHNRDFLYKPRGFESVYEMNDAILKNWNSTVDMGDDVYVLGDLMLNDNDGGIKLFKQLKGNIHVLLGNHDTDARVDLYRHCYNVVDVKYADILKYNGYHFFLCHYPTITTNISKESLKQAAINLFGHTHSKDKFYGDNPFMYNVACDAHNCTPVSLDCIINDVEGNFASRKGK